MKRLLLFAAAALSASSLLAAGFTTDPPEVVAGPPATVGDMVANRSTTQPQPLGAIVPGAYGFTNQILINVAINAPGRNNTFYETDYFTVNGRNANQEILIGLIAAGVTNVNQPAQRFLLNANTTYSLDNFFGTGTGRLNLTGVASVLIIGVLTGTNTVDSNARLYGSVRIWTMEPGSSGGTNSFTLWGADRGLIHGDFNAIAVGGRQNTAFRANYTVVNLDATRSRTFTAIFIGGGTAQATVSLPPLSMQQVAVPSSLVPGTNGYFVSVFFPNDTDDFQWSASLDSADNITGDAWHSPIAFLPTAAVEY